jgi:predicted transcriptional regulator
MARKTPNHRFDLPPLELQCMQALWALGKGSVREIRSWLLSERPLAYTTVMTVMDRLARKGVVEREKLGRAHLYRPRFAENQIRDRALERLVANFFQGSRADLHQYLSAGTTEAAKPQAPSAPGLQQIRPAPRRQTAGTRTAPRIDPSLL